MAGDPPSSCESDTHDANTACNVRAFTPEDEPAVIAIWHDCELTRPWNDPHEDIATRLRVDPDLFLVATRGGAIVGSVMGGFDGHRGWAYYLGVAPNHRKQGIARTLMAELERRLQERGCPKINLMVRNENEQAIGFYKALGYGVDDVTNLGKRLDGR